MATLNVKDPFAHTLASKIAERTGETITETVIVALMERLSRVESIPHHVSSKERLLSLIDEAARTPILDHRTADEIIGYDENGLFS